MVDWYDVICSDYDKLSCSSPKCSPVDLFFCSVIKNYYIGAAWELSRLNGVCKAPVIQHFSESLSGSMIKRSFDQNQRFIDTNFHLSDQLSRPKLHSAAAMEWLCFRFDTLSSLMFAFSLVFLISMPRGAIDPGNFSEHSLSSVFIMDIGY